MKTEIKTSVATALVTAVLMLWVAQNPAVAGWKSKVAIAGVGILAKKCLSSPACRGRGIGTIKNTAIEMFNRYGKDTMNTCVRDRKCIMQAVDAIAKGKTTILMLDAATRSKQVAEARKGLSSGNLKPPGFCTPDENSRLSAEVNKFCKQGKLRACKNTDNKLTLVAKAADFLQCKRARSIREDKCYKGGDSGHKQQIQSLSNGEANCWTLFAGKQ